MRWSFLIARAAILVAMPCPCQPRFGWQDALVRRGHEKSSVARHTSRAAQRLLHLAMFDSGKRGHVGAFVSYRPPPEVRVPWLLLRGRRDAPRTPSSLKKLRSCIYRKSAAAIRRAPCASILAAVPEGFRRASTARSSAGTVVGGGYARGARKARLGERPSTLPGRGPAARRVAYRTRRTPPGRVPAQEPLARSRPAARKRRSGRARRHRWGGENPPQRETWRERARRGARPWRQAFRPSGTAEEGEIAKVSSP
jgi:hypothetical protein